MSDPIKPFTIAVPDEVLEDLHHRLDHTRFPDQIPDTGWSYGADMAYIKALCSYWRASYDWRRHEKELNRFSQFQTEIEGQNIHFIHVRSKQETATPLLIIHGWPGSISEFMKIIEPLTDPQAHGGSPEDAFHVVCPSLPGYGFSGPTRQTLIDTQAMAEMFAQLMARLGYEAYVAQGGDWGAIISSNLGVLDADHLLGIHLNMPFALPPDESAKQGLTEKELADLDDMARFETEETGYQKIQGTKPQSLGVALNDSPAGLAAWITEKFYTWTDCNGDVESVITKDELLTNIMIYWATQTITSSTRLYFETMKHARLPFLFEKVEVPTGIARYPKEIMRHPRKLVENHYHVVHWTEMPQGGHFAAMEQPESLVKDIRDFVRKIRKS